VVSVLVVVTKWTGALATALQVALRMTNWSYARHLSVGKRTVDKWHERPDMVLDLQETLDTALVKATFEQQVRFAKQAKGLEHNKVVVLGVGMGT
jgi:8-oxo-dGTP diphosphatase